ncbi:alpha/beta fold hydrolase [Nocardia concava]|uniref:alpha/beta fold hydrolase n=1 Tax=Nocardia concava TaxID=257281 RepID=UPI000A0588A8
MQPGDGRSALPAPVPDGAVSRYATVNGVRLHYVIAGSGDPVLLLHGWPETWYAWRKVIPILADRFTVVAPDMRGYGDSERPADGYDKVTVATDLHELMRSLGFGGVHLVVQDMGGPVGFAYAASFLEDVRDLVFIESAVPGVRPGSGDGCGPRRQLAHGFQHGTGNQRAAGRRARAAVHRVFLPPRHAAPGRADAGRHRRICAQLCGRRTRSELRLLPDAAGRCESQPR